MPIEIPDFLPQKPGQLPPLSSSKKNASSSKKLILKEGQSESDYQMELPVNRVIAEYQMEMNRYKKENDELRYARDIAEKNYHILMNDNNAL